MIVESFSFSWTTFQMVCSVSGSTCGVGSSKITILFCCSNNRAKQISWRSPTLTFPPYSNNSWFSCPSRLSTKSFSCTSSRAHHNSASWNCSIRSRFFLSDPLKRTGLWPRIDIERRVSQRFISFIRTSSTVIPPSASGMRIREATNEDFPAPVRPAIPIFSPPLIVRLIFFSTWGPPG